MRKLDITADELVRKLLKLPETEHVSILDSCGVGHLGSHLLIAGVRPVEVVELSGGDVDETLRRIEKLVTGPRAVVFTLSYDLGAKLVGIDPGETHEPDVFAAVFESLIVHDYAKGTTHVAGNTATLPALEGMLRSGISDLKLEASNCSQARSNFTRNAYLATIETIKERIRSGDTYQTNLTQQITIGPSDTRPQDVFWRLRGNHPAPFAVYMKRLDSTVVSASPERFFRVSSPHVSKGSMHGVVPMSFRESTPTSRIIATSPIKGTRRRGLTPDEDALLKCDLLTSPKDRAENTMIVDLLRNDLGRVCDYGSVRVEKLCELEEHPTLFHLVSTASGDLRDDASFADIIRALFPCGSITGAPKISTVRIIDELEHTPRGLSMGAIGYSIPQGFDGLDPVIDLSVAIRTIVFRNGVATFNVGGGITIDSDPQEEHEESLLKAKALLKALNAQLIT